MGIMRLPACRFATLLLVLAAMVFRGVVPAGWMPGISAGTPLVICTPAGHVHLYLDNHGKPARHDNDRTDPCPFGAAPHFATLNASIPPPTPPRLETDAGFAARFDQLPDSLNPFDHAPRGPPTIA